ncbi:MAG: hypothetical protein AAEJ53_06265 [Myxococcota bacterium]
MNASADSSSGTFPSPEAAFRRAAEDAIEHDDPRELADLVQQIAQEATPQDWAQSCCIQLSRHRSAEVRGNAVAGFGHLARRFGRVEPQGVQRRVKIALHDPSAYVRSQARSAALDLHTFLGWELETDES